MVLIINKLVYIILDHIPNMSTSNYDFSNNVNESIDAQPKPKSLRQTYGHIPVVEASFNLLFKFLVNQTYWYSNQSGNENKQTINWAKKLVTGDPSPLSKYYGKLFDVINGAIEEFPHSGTVRLTSVYQEDKQKFYVRFIFNKNEITKKFLESKNMTYQEFMKQNGLTLGEANPTHVLHQMTQRLGSLIYRLEGSNDSNGEASCEYDFDAIESLKNVQDYFSQLLQEAKLHMSQYKKPVFDDNSEKRTNSRSVSQRKVTNNKEEIPTAPKKAQIKLEVKPSLPAIQVPKAPTNIFASKNVSYASATTGIATSITTPVDRSHNKFATLVGDTELVDDLDIQLDIPETPRKTKKSSSPVPSATIPPRPTIVASDVAPNDTSSHEFIIVPTKKNKKSKAVVNTNTDNTKVVDNKAVNTKAVTAKAVNTKAVNTKAVNTKAVNTKAVNTKAVNVKPVNTNTQVTQPLSKTDDKILIYVSSNSPLNGAPQLVPRYVSKQFIEKFLEEETTQDV